MLKIIKFEAAVKKFINGKDVVDANGIKIINSQDGRYFIRKISIGADDKIHYDIKHNIADLHIS